MSVKSAALPHPISDLPYLALWLSRHGFCLRKRRETTSEKVPIQLNIWYLMFEDGYSFPIVPNEDIYLLGFDFAEL